MTRNLNRGAIVLLVTSLLVVSASAQKVKVGYDKSADFSKYTTYTWVEPSVPPSRPILYSSVVGWIARTLDSKGLKFVESEGDLILIPSGGMEFGINTQAGAPVVPSYSGPPVSIDSNMWTGTNSSSNVMAPYVPEGALILTFIDRRTNKVVWSGTVTQKLDIERKEKSLKLAEKAVMKLLSNFPPSKK